MTHLDKEVEVVTTLRLREKRRVHAAGPFLILANNSLRMTPTVNIETCALFIIEARRDRP
jgi:hypothetical protein